ncbi:MAG TPA: stage II sporulation protein M [Flavobacteriaceae bacterium]|nr:stage II sporulation protein M [Flavobacteriaceae bacterium]
MREAAFIKQNRNKWTKFENIISNKVQVSPDELSELYLEITDDLSYAQTFYPKSNTSSYLNMLAYKAHQKIYKTKKESSNRLINFFIKEFPLFFYKYQKQLLLAFVVFFVFVILGVLSATQDETFTRVILGDAYIDMTLSNIEKGDPMAVYKQQTEMNMFLGITINNIRVALLAFTLGVLLGVGTVYVMMSNGIMLGVFQYFFYEEGMLWESMRTIWIHGTIEIAVIIVAACGGLVVGRGILFPGTYSRVKSFTLAVKDGLKIVVSTIPFFIIAGFLEGFVTRHTDMPDWLAVVIIGGSLALILFYYVFYPIHLHKKQEANAATRID